MSKSQHNLDSAQNTENQNNEMSDDPRDGSRNSDLIGQAHKPNPMEKTPPNDRQDQSTIEAFGQEGAGIASKE
jgi:hypothetical protein